MSKDGLVDIHSHIIANVDDGSSGIEASIYLLKEAEKAGVSDIILTPHYRRGMFEKSVEVIKEKYLDLVNFAKSNHIEINLLLGQEIFIKTLDSFKKYLQEEKLIPLNNTNYYLLEFSYENEIDISEVVYNAKLLGKKIIIAHIEKYEYVDLDEVIEIRNSGALIQVNATSVIGGHGFKLRKRAMKYIKNGLVDFIASDVHEERSYDYLKAYKYIASRFGNKVSDKLFKENAKEYLLR